MDDKRRDAGTLVSSSSFGGGADSPATEPASSHRRAGGNKRKANNLGSSDASPAPSKRIIRDKGLNSHPLFHNDPLTRARQGTINLSSGIGRSNASPVTFVKPEDPVWSQDGAASEDLSKACREWEALEASIEAEVETVRSRDPNAHVVPCHCGGSRTGSRSGPVE